VHAQEEAEGHGPDAERPRSLGGGVWRRQQEAGEVALGIAPLVSHHELHRRRTLNMASNSLTILHEARGGGEGGERRDECASGRAKEGGGARWRPTPARVTTRRSRANFLCALRL
jgi:hypothetical protein